MAYNLFDFSGSSGSSALPWSAATAPDVKHSNSWMEYPGGAIGGIIGGIYGGPMGAELGLGAGKNAGQSVGDLFGGNWKGLGVDASSAAPPGMNQPMLNLFGYK